MNPERPNAIRVQLPTFENIERVRNAVQVCADMAVKKTSEHLPIHELTLQIKDDPRGVIPEHAHSGWTHSADNITIKFDPYFPNKEQLLEIELPRSISHELHHAVRLKSLPDEPRYLGAALIFEGLATCFETEVWGGKPSKWAGALSQNQIDDLLKKVNCELNDANYKQARWFFGSDDIPRWAGYTIGAYLVKEYLKQHPDQTCASLVATPSKVILDSLKSSVLLGE